MPYREFVVIYVIRNRYNKSIYWLLSMKIRKECFRRNIFKNKYEKESKHGPILNVFFSHT